MQRGSMRFVLVLMMAAISLALVACGDDDEDDGAAPAGTGGTQQAATAAPTEVKLDPGVTATEVVIGMHIPLSGPNAVAAPISQAAKAYYEHINRTQGGVNGRKITLEVRDDEFSPVKGRQVVQELVEQRNVFAIVGGLGTPAHLAVADYLNEKKVPDLFVISNFGGFNDPAKRPYTFTALPSGAPEGQVVGTYVNDKHTGARVGVLLQNDDFGRDYLRGFKEVFKGTVAAERTYEVVEVDTSSQVASLIAARSDVLVFVCTPVPCANAVRAARGAGSRAQIILAAPNNTELMFQLAGGPQGPANMEGAIVPAFSKTIGQTTDPAVQAHVEIMRAANLQPSTFTIYGQLIAQLFIEVLRRAGPTPTRQGVVAAAEGLSNFQLELALTPVSMSKSDHSAWSGLRFWRAEGGKFVPFGDVVPLKGR